MTSIAVIVTQGAATLYPGGYCVSRDYFTGLYARPTLFSRYYGGRNW